MSGDIMQATRLLESAENSRRRFVVADASAFLPVSLERARALYRKGMSVDQLRARIEADLRGGS